MRMTQTVVQMDESVLQIDLGAIDVGERARKDLGDIDGLAASIETIGLLQPIGIDANYRLVFGERRLRAFERLGRGTIPARLVDVASVLLAEHAENEIRKDFTPSERVAIAKAIEDEIGNRRGQRTDLKSEDQSDLIEHELPENLPEVEAGKETRQIAAAKAGFGNETTYRQAKTVVEHAEPELVEAMDRGDVAISTAAKLAKTEPDLQRTAAADPKKAIELAKQASAAKVREIKQSSADIANEKRETKRTSIVERLEAVASREIEAPTGLYDVIVIDPPWPMVKIERAGA
jgi:ParB family chromosome partitioning protein